MTDMQKLQDFSNPGIKINYEEYLKMTGDQCQLKKRSSEPIKRGSDRTLRTRELFIDSTELEQLEDCSESEDLDSIESDVLSQMR